MAAPLKTKPASTSCSIDCMSSDDAGTTLDVRSEQRVMVTVGAVIVWLDIYEVADERFFTVCKPCGESVETTSRDYGSAWAERHVRRAHAGDDTEGFSAPTGIGDSAATAEVCGHPTAGGSACQNRVRGTKCAAGHHR